MQIYEISRTSAIKKASFLASALIFPSVARKTADFVAGKRKKKVTNK